MCCPASSAKMFTNVWCELIKAVLVALLWVGKLHGHCLRCRCAWAEAALSAGAVSSAASWVLGALPSLLVLIASAQRQVLARGSTQHWTSAFGTCVLGAKALLLQDDLAHGQADAGQLPASLP